jgi:hypothetical protein
MEKSHSDHLIKQIGFIPLVIDALFLGDDNMTLDYYETMLFKHGKVKTAGYVGSGGLFKVIIDTRELDFIPFDYIYTYSDKMHMDVRKAVWADAKRRQEEADKQRAIREEFLSRPGTKVYVSYRSHCKHNFRSCNGVVISRDLTGVTVALDDYVIQGTNEPFQVLVDAEQLSEWHTPQRIVSLRGELNVWVNCIRATYEKAFGVDTRATDRVKFTERLKQYHAELNELETQHGLDLTPLPSYP